MINSIISMKCHRFVHIVLLAGRCVWIVHWGTIWLLDTAHEQNRSGLEILCLYELSSSSSTYLTVMNSTAERKNGSSSIYFLI